MMEIQDCSLEAYQIVPVDEVAAVLGRENQHNCAERLTKFYPRGLK